MRWSKVLIAALAGTLAGGCEFFVTFETFPEGSGGTTSNPCTVDADCPAPSNSCRKVACKSSVCVETDLPDDADAVTQTEGDCKKDVCQDGKAMTNPDNEDVPDDGNLCTIQGCVGGTPTLAVEPAGTRCGMFKVCDDSGNCGNDVGAPCIDQLECAVGDCIDGVCCNTPCRGVCQACNVAGSVGACTNIPSGMDPDNECRGTSICNGSGACLSLKNNSDACGAGNECSSGYCIDGVCCDTPCTGICMSCGIVGQPGTCSFIPQFESDPDNECPNFGVCDGMGGCI